MRQHGHLYQGRFKSFPVETDEHFYQVIRYAERNALRANLVSDAEEWPWGSLWIDQFGAPEHHAMLSRWPPPRPRSWLQYVNKAQTEAELESLRRSCTRGTPYGSAQWVEQTVKELRLEATMRNPGRPKKR